MRSVANNRTDAVKPVCVVIF